MKTAEVTPPTNVHGRCCSQNCMRFFQLHVSHLFMHLHATFYSTKSTNVHLHTLHEGKLLTRIIYAGFYTMTRKGYLDQ